MPPSSPAEHHLRLTSCQHECTLCEGSPMEVLIWASVDRNLSWGRNSLQTVQCSLSLDIRLPRLEQRSGWFWKSHFAPLYLAQNSWVRILARVVSSAQILPPHHPQLSSNLSTSEIPLLKKLCVLRLGEAIVRQWEDSLRSRFSPSFFPWVPGIQCSHQAHMASAFNLLSHIPLTPFRVYIYSTSPCYLTLPFTEVIII